MRRSGVTARTSAQRAGLLTALAFTALALGLAAPAASAAPVGSLTSTSSLSVAQGGTVTISGNVTPSGNCAPGSIVQLTSTPDGVTANLFPGGLGPKVATDASGNFHTSIVIPLSTPVGSYTIGVLCGPVTVPTNEILNVTAATHPPSITVSPSSTPRGGAVTIAGVVPTTGASLCPGADTAQLTSTLFPAGLGPQVTRSATGAFSTSYTVASTATPGTYSIGIRCGGGNVGVSTSLAVTTAAAVTTTTVAPTTTTTTATTTPVSPTTTLAPLSLLPATTTTLVPPATKSKSKSRTLRWVALAVFALVVVAAVVVIIAKRDR